MPSPAKATENYALSEEFPYNEEGLAVDVDLKVETKVEIQASLQQSASSPVVKSPYVRKQLFRPSPSASVSSPPPPRKRARGSEGISRADLHDKEDIRSDSRVHHTPFNASKKSKHDMPVHAAHGATEYEDEGSDKDYPEQIEPTYEPSPTSVTGSSEAGQGRKHILEQQTNRQAVNSLQNLVSQTWPVVQKSLLELR